jgi:riboflavin kinase/FMN adenylyltransferase
MKVHHSLLDLTKNGDCPPVGITIGNFDGVHLGHQQLLRKIKSDCLSRDLDFVVVTFTPHPQKILRPGKERFLINGQEQRRVLLEGAGVDHLVEVLFTRDFSTLAPENFVRDHLLVYPNIKTIYLGYDFAFGANKQGGHDAIRTMCTPLGIDVQVQPKFEINGLTVSSSLIRDRLLTGKVDEVHELLGRPFQLEGVVVKGEGRGRKIGFPTANIQVSQDLLVPTKGVYITRTVYRDMTYNSVTNIGNNPTFKTGQEIHIETNLFDFDLDIYGERIDIQFLHKVRDEKKFPTVNDLIEQIRQDVETAKKHLKHV